MDHCDWLPETGKPLPCSDSKFQYDKVHINEYQNDIFSILRGKRTLIKNIKLRYLNIPIQYIFGEFSGNLTVEVTCWIEVNQKSSE